MNREIKIMIFALILVFSFLKKQSNNFTSFEDEKREKVTTPKKQINTPKKNNSNNTKKRFTPNTNNKTLANPKFFLTPKNGFSPYNSCFGKGVYNNNTGNAFIIKNSNSTDAVVLLVNSYTSRKVRNEFIRKGETFKMTGVPHGTYYLEWMSGNDWSPELTDPTDGSETELPSAGIGIQPRLMSSAVPLPSCDEGFSCGETTNGLEAQLVTLAAS